MYESILVWAGLALLVLLCLPFSGIQKLVLEVYGWALRLALLALLAFGGVLWFRPELLPDRVASVVAGTPLLRSILPDPGSQVFGVCAASLVALVLLPLLAALDVTRKLAGERLRRLRALTAGRRPEATEAMPSPALERRLDTELGPRRRVDRRSAADTMAEAGSRKPFRVADHVS